MKILILALIAAFALLFAGCAGSPPAAPVVQPPAPPAQNNTVPPAPPVVNNTSQVNNTTQTAPPAPVDTCTVEFQRDTNSIYLVLVKTDSGKAITVRCPNGEMGEARGNLFLCTQLDIDVPVAAYLDGKECGSASFQHAVYEKTSGSKSTCTVYLSHSRLTAGQSSEITVQTSSGGTEVTLTYTCGSETKTQKRSGLMTDGSNCRFDVPGTYAVEAKIDGEVCDSKVIEVFKNAHECFVLQDAMNFSMIGSDYDYTAQVSGRGYSAEDTLHYKCYGAPFEVKVGTLPSSTDFVATIECRSKIGPMPEKNVSVQVGADSCGTVAVPQ